jgi:type IV pilus assembly protein PilY1
MSRLRFSILSAALIAAAGAISPAHGQAVISNGTIALGVNQAGALNVESSAGGYYGGVGVRYLPANWDGTYAGCTCEGWGAGIAGGTYDGTWGGQNTAEGGITNLSNITFSSTASTATSAVTIQSGGTDLLRVTQAYAPSAVSPNLYQVTVTLTNLTGGTLGMGTDGIRYRRTMDWDIPVPGREIVSLAGWPAANLLGTSSNGFIDENVFDDPGAYCGAPQNANFTDVGPCDHGANFDFGFPALAAGASQTLTIFYGAAANLAEAKAALGAVGAEVASWAYCGSGQGDPVNGGTCVGSDGPTFVFGFQGVGGTPIEPPTTVTPEPASVLLTATGLGFLLVGARRRRKSV